MDNFTSHRHSNLPPVSELPIRQVESQSLLGQEGRVVIVHAGQHYLLRQTQAGKLILTK